MAVTITVTNSQGQYSQQSIGTFPEVGAYVESAMLSARIGKRDQPGYAPWAASWSGTYVCPTCGKTRSCSGSFTA